jgi:hypothetical protein
MDSVTATISPASLERVKNALDEFTIKTQDGIVRTALRNYSKQVARLTRAMTPSASGVSDKSLSYKAKMHSSGVGWSAVGFKTSGRPVPKGTKSGRGLRKVYDSYGSGWRSHFTELGFHAYPIGRPSPWGGRGWKRGQYHRGQGQFHIGTFASIKAQEVLGSTLLRHLQVEIYKATQQLNGRKPTKKGIAMILEGGV